MWVLLMGKGGKAWRVGLLKLHETLFFNEGWSGFVCDNLVEFGDTLVFEYSGDWQFEVYVCDESGCEKDVRECRGQFGMSCGKRRGREEEDVILGDISGGSLNKRGSYGFQCSMDLVNEKRDGLIAKPCQHGGLLVEPLAVITYDEARPTNQLNYPRNHSNNPAFPSLCKPQTGLKLPTMIFTI